MLKKIIINILKISIALGLIVWLIKSDKLDFTILKDTLKTPWIILTAILVFQVVSAASAFRLSIILHQKIDKPLSLLKMYFANWIGQFFNSVLPGSVSGDLVKIFYVQKLNRKLTKKFLLISVFIDRVVGLVGLIFLGGLVSLVNYNSLTNLSHDVTTLTHINIIIFFCLFISISLLFIAPNFPYKLSTQAKKVPLKIITKIMLKLEELWADLLIFKNKLMKRRIRKINSSHTPMS